MDYDRIAERYDEHRSWEEVFPRRLIEVVSSNPSERPRPPLLEIGCGTGNLTRWLISGWKGAVVGVDLSRGMLAKAHAKLPAAKLLRATGQRLPFAAAQFAGAVGSYVLHHMDPGARKRTFSELHRVLGAEGQGRLAFLTSSHAQIRASYLNRWFPSLARIDCARFPDIEDLRGELLDVGFENIELEEVIRSNPRGDRTYLEKVKSRFISTLDLISAEEFKAGVAALEKEVQAQGHAGDVSWRATIVSGRKSTP